MAPGPLPKRRKPTRLPTAYRLPLRFHRQVGTVTIDALLIIFLKKTSRRRRTPQVEALAELLNETYETAVEVLKGNATSYGLKASRAYYNQVWARDAFISSLGANLLRDPQLLRSARASIDTFAKTASPLGQIANHFDLARNRPEYGLSGATDASTWYIIGVASLFGATEDRTLLRAPLDAAISAYRWLRYQDANNLWLIDSPEGADWMDASVQRTGKTLYNNVLFLMANRCIESLCSRASKPIDAAAQAGPGRP